MKKKLELIGEIPTRDKSNTVHLLGVWQEIIETSPGNWQRGCKSIRDTVGNVVISNGNNCFTITNLGIQLTAITPQG